MPIKFAAKKVGWSQSDKGFVLRLLVSPDDDWTEAANAPLGSPFGVVMVPIDIETGVSKETSPGSGASSVTSAGQRRDQSGKSRQPFHKLSRAQQAGILCSDLTFQLWLSNQVKADIPQAEDAATFVRQICGVHSRADLSEDRVAGKKWDQIVTNFYEATGRLAEQRG